jgi:phenylalanyl-tRNA synthetase beta chain
MKFTWNWLKEFVDVAATPGEIAERLTMAGLEVDAVDALGEGLDGVLCAEVVSVRPHPNADKLRVCEVRLGDGDSAAVVCGAPNVAVGQRVPFARPGTVLPNGTVIAATEIRGVASAGMLCSAVEIGAGEDASGLLVLPATMPLGARVAEVLGLSDVVLELSITPNRGDCLSVLGIAREIAALTGATMRAGGESAPMGDALVDGAVAVTIAAPELCRRYVGRVLRDIRIAPSPAWMQARLRAVGLRPINNVVDITNYVLIERGQPLHAFDLDRLPAPEITVRCAGAATPFTTLDGQERRLAAEDLVITSGGEAVAVAGVMGGESSEVTDGTVNVLLESAWFQPEAIRRTSKRLGLRSESSYRFERGVDLEGVLPASGRAAALMEAHAGARPAAAVQDACPDPWRPEPITLRVARVEALLGVPVAEDELVERLSAFAMPTTRCGAGELAVVAPSYRHDITREVDVIEEVARSLGYERIPPTLPQSRLEGGGQGAAALRQRELRQLLAAQGFAEIVTLSFASPARNRLLRGLVPDRAPVRILNPLTQDESEMRLSLLSGVLQAASYNLAQGSGSFSGFSLSKVFWAEHAEYRERLGLALVVCPALGEDGVGGRRGDWEFADIKGVAETVIERFPCDGVGWIPYVSDPAFHPGKSARIEVDGETLGVVGCLHPGTAEELSLADPVWCLELDLQKLLDYRPRPVVCEELPRFPVVVRDLALVAEETFASDRVVRFVRDWQGASGLIEAVKLFDQYVGSPIPEGKKSMAFSIAYRSRERTLTDAEVNEVHGELVTQMRAELPVEMR